MELVLAALVLAAVLVFLAGPLRREREAAPDLAAEADVADLEARKEAKYREIRDAQLDHAQGKLSDADYRRLDEDLRREAVAILRALDEARAARGYTGRR